MRIEDCYYLGTITKTHGLEGDVLIKIDTDQPELYYNLESAFLNMNSQLVPYFFENIGPYKENILKARFKETEAETVVGHDIFLPLDSLPSLEGNAFYYHEVIGFDIYDGATLVGPIIEINDNAAQDFFVVVRSDTTELAIPVIKDWITNVNREEKTIAMTLPEGILDI